MLKKLHQFNFCINVFVILITKILYKHDKTICNSNPHWFGKNSKSLKIEFIFLFNIEIRLNHWHIQIPYYLYTVIYNIAFTFFQKQWGLDYSQIKVSTIWEVGQKYKPTYFITSESCITNPGNLNTNYICHICKQQWHEFIRLLNTEMWSMTCTEIIYAHDLYII